MAKKAKPKDHKLKTGRREVAESYCDEKGCAFYGKPARQGICHTVLDADAERILAWVRLYEKEVELEIDEAVAKKNADQKIAWLRSFYVAAAVNWQFGTNQLIEARRKNALLELRVADLERQLQEASGAAFQKRIAGTRKEKRKP